MMLFLGQLSCHFSHTLGHILGDYVTKLLGDYVNFNPSIWVALNHALHDAQKVSVSTKVGTVLN